MGVLDRLILRDNQWTRMSPHIIGNERSRGTSGREKLKQFRRVATRYEKTANNYMAVVMLATTVLWLR